MRSEELRECLRRSFAYRDCDGVVRLAAGAADHLPGIVIDQFGKLCVGTIYNSESTIAPELLLAELEKIGRFSHLLVRCRLHDEREGNLYRFLYGGGFSEELSVVAEEAGIKFAIRAKVRDDFGVFPDACEARRLVRAISAERRVLNLFAYTCGFGLAAKLGGATEVVNVDPNRDYLGWGRENALLNGVDFHLIPDTAQAYLRRLNRRVAAGTRAAPDVVVLDPPAFGVGRGNDRLVRSLWPELLELIAALSPSHMVVLCNDRYLRERVDVTDLLRQHFPQYSVESVAQHSSILGQFPGERDRFYSPPLLVHLCRSTVS